MFIAVHCFSAHYVALGISKHHTFKPLICLLKIPMFQFTTSCPMTYDTLLATGRSFPCAVNQSFNLTLMVFSNRTNLSTKHKFILFFCELDKMPCGQTGLAFVSSFASLRFERWLVWDCKCAYK